MGGDGGDVNLDMIVDGIKHDWEKTRVEDMIPPPLEISLERFFLH